MGDLSIEGDLSEEIEAFQCVDSGTGAPPDETADSTPVNNGNKAPQCLNTCTKDNQNQRNPLNPSEYCCATACSSQDPDKWDFRFVQQGDGYKCDPLNNPNDVMDSNGNRAPECLQAPCGREQQNQPNSDGTRYCCATNCRAEPSFEWYRKGEAAACTPSDEVTNNQNRAPNCISPCSFLQVNQPNSDGTRFCCATSQFGNFYWVERGTGYNFLGNGNERPNCLPCSRCEPDYNTSSENCGPDEPANYFLRQSMGITDLKDCNYRNTCDSGICQGGVCSPVR